MRTLFLITGFLLISQCHAQQKKHPKIETSKKTEMNRPQIDDKFETLNLEDYKDDIKIEKNPNLEKGKIIDVYKYRKESEDEIVEIDGTKEYLLRYIETFNNKPYSVFKQYYGKNGYIYRKRIFSKITDIVLGKEYQFDEKGNLIKTIDHDKGWDFSYENVLHFVDQKYGDKVEYSVQYAFNVRKKKTYDNKNYWEITIKPGFKDDNIHEYDLLKLEGTTGEILCYQQWTDNYGEPIKLVKTIIPDTTEDPSNKTNTSLKTK